MALTTLVGSKAAVWILTVVLSGDDSTARSYEFLSREDCEAVMPAIKELYFALGETSVDATCKPGESALPVQPLKTNMIWSL